MPVWRIPHTRSILSRVKLPALLAAAGLLLAACSSSRSPGGSSSAPQTLSAASVDVNGYVILSGTHSVRQANYSGSPCWAPGNVKVIGTPSQWDDVKKGAQVIITDAAGKTVGIGKLGAGVTTRAGSAAHRPPCEFNFTVHSVPTGSRFYGVRVGKHSGQVPAADIQSAKVRF